MAVIESWVRCDLKKPVQVQMLNGNLFSMDNQGNKIGVEVYDNGEEATVTGTVSGNVIRADGATVAVSGTLSGNKASIVLPQSAYAVPGFITIVIKLTDSGVITTLAAVTGIVYRTSTDTVVDPGTVIPDISTLIAEIEAAVASIPADYSDLWESLAPAFSSSISYYAGQYVTYNGGVYRFINSHSGSWSASDVIAVNIGGELYDLKGALNADVLNLDELLKFGTMMNFNFTEGCALNSSGIVFYNTSNAQKRMTTVDFIDISAARKTNNIPISDNGYNEGLTYTIETGYRVFVAFYETPSESSANRDIVGWVSGSGTLTPNYNYMRICMGTSDDTAKVTKADAVNLNMSLYPTIKSVIDKINHWGLTYKGYADAANEGTENLSFDNVVDVGMYVIANSVHSSAANNPIVGSDGTLLVVPASTVSSKSPKLITGLIQIAISNNGSKIYVRRVSGASTKTFGNWYKPLWGDWNNIKTRTNTDADPGFTADNFESGGISESGGNITNNKRIRTKGYVSLGINNCIRYAIQSGYRAYFVPFTSGGASYNKPGTGWLQGSGILRFSDDIHYYRFALASIDDETSLTTADYNKVTVEYDYKLNDTFIDIVQKTKWLALGDSITYGVYSTGAGVEVKSSNGWVNQLAGSLGYDLNNMGAPGVGFATERSDTSTNKTFSDILDEVDLLADNYNLITVAFGINDYNKSSITLEQIQTSIDTGIQRLMTKFPAARLVFITPFNSNRRGDASTNYCFNYEYGGRSLKDIADLIQSRCASVGVECIYASNGFLLNNYNIGMLLPDSTHPSTECHKLIAKNMAHFLLN